MLLKGIHPKVASEMLGHASFAITLDLYSHVLPDMQRESVMAMARVLEGYMDAIGVKIEMRRSGSHLGSHSAALAVPACAIPRAPLAPVALVATSSSGPAGASSRAPAACG